MKPILTTTRILIVLSILVMVSHIFPIISTPITSITLSNFMGFSYGVFGWCYTRKRPSKSTMCTKRRIGYVSLNTHIYGRILYLPSESKYSISRLLVVHIIALLNSLILSVMIIIIEFTKFGESSRFALATALVSIPSFIFTLFCFLVDIILFSTHLNWPGWGMLSSTIATAFICSFLWSVRRTVSTRNYEASRSIPNRPEDERYSIDAYSNSVDPQSDISLVRDGYHVEQDSTLFKPETVYQTEYH